MPSQRCESHHRICNLRYGTRGYGMSTYRILRPDFLNHAVCFLDITVKLAFLVKLHAVPQGRMVRERGRGMERQHDFRMDAAALAGGIIT